MLQDRELIEEYISKLDFAEHFLRDEFPKISSKLDSIVASDINEKYFENLRNDIEVSREMFLKVMEQEQEAFNDIAKTANKNKDFLINTISIIEERLNKFEDKIENNSCIFKVLFFTLSSSAVSVVATFLLLRYFFV